MNRTTQVTSHNINPNHLSADGDPKNYSVGVTFANFRSLKLPPFEPIIFGLARGYVGMLNAITNGNKSTLCRNLLISLCTGKGFAPILCKSHPHKVALLDFEDNKIRLQSDLLTMASGLTEYEHELLDKNALIFCEEQDRTGSCFSLSDPAHRELITHRLREFGPDLIIVDTISSAMRIENENDNAEIKNKIMNPLRRLARDTDSALLATHHMGKKGLDYKSPREKSQKGRGASCFADHSDLIMNLEFNEKTNSVKLECGKVKGEQFVDTTFQIGAESRWLRPIAQKLEVESAYQKLLSSFEGEHTYKTGELIGKLSDQILGRTVKNELKRAVELGTVVKVCHGVYQKVQ